jgi:hypothetical protein
MMLADAVWMLKETETLSSATVMAAHLYTRGS